MKNRGLFVLAFLKRFAMGLLIIFLFSGIVMLLWNFLIPDILGLKTINFWQSAAMIALSRILFGNFWGHNFGDRHHDHFNFKKREQLREKWMEMTDEERKTFFDKRREFFGDHPFSREDFWSNRCNRKTKDEPSKSE